MTQTPSPAVELLPCPNPWCNSHKSEDLEIRAAEAPCLMPSRASYEWAVACPVCPIQTPWRDTEAEALAAWNTRTSLPTRDAAIEEAAKVAEGLYAGHGNSLRTARAYTYEHAGRAIAKAIRALSTPTSGEASAPPPLSEGWTPTAANINALPDPLRRYIHDLETRCDPTGDVQTIHSQREQINGLLKRLRELSTPAESGVGAREDVERLLTLIETAHEHGDEEAIVEQAAKVRQALGGNHD